MNTLSSKTALTGVSTDLNFDSRPSLLFYFTISGSTRKVGLGSDFYILPLFFQLPFTLLRAHYGSTFVWTFEAISCLSYQPIMVALLFYHALCSLWSLRTSLSSPRMSTRSGVFLTIEFQVVVLKMNLQVFSLHLLLFLLIRLLSFFLWLLTDCFFCTHS